MKSCYVVYGENKPCRSLAHKHLLLQMITLTSKTSVCYHLNRRKITLKDKLFKCSITQQIIHLLQIYHNIMEFLIAIEAAMFLRGKKVMI